MRTKLAILIVAAAIVGCEDKKSEPSGPGSSSPSPVIFISKTSSGGGGESSRDDAATPVAGLIKGKPFTPGTVTLQGKTLTFRSGKDFFADMEISFPLPDDAGSKLEGKEWKLGGKKFGDPMLNVGAKEGKADFAHPEIVWGDDYAMTLKINKQTATSVEGTINLRVTKPANTHLVGKFVATIKKTGNEPLEKDDAPYVHGKIAIKGDWKELSIAVGFVGKGTDGKQYSNMIGIPIKPKGTESGTSTSFAPQLTSILNGNDGPTYRHTRMAPGDYFIYVRRGEVIAAWKSISVKAGDEQKIDLSIDLANVGSLVATLPDDEANDAAEWRLKVIPDVDIPGGTFNFAFDTVEVKKGQRTATVNNIPAGKYKIVRGKSEAEVEIVVGNPVAVTLVRKK